MINDPLQGKIRAARKALMAMRSTGIPFWLGWTILAFLCLSSSAMTVMDASDRRVDWGGRVTTGNLKTHGSVTFDRREGRFRIAWPGAF